MRSITNYRTLAPLLLIGATCLFYIVIRLGQINIIKFSFEPYIENPEMVQEYFLLSVEQKREPTVPFWGPNGRVGLGVFVLGDPTVHISRLIAFEQLIGHRMEYGLLFHSWENNAEFPTEILHYYEHLKITPIITWMPWDSEVVDDTTLQEEYLLSSIRTGIHDNYIRTWAKAASEHPQKIILRFGHEMNTPIGERVWYPWQGDPVNYVSAFKHIVDIFRAEGAENVQFMWNPIFFPGAETADRYYPGDAYVDVIGITAINLGEVIDSKGVSYHWLDCDVLIDNQVEMVRKYQKEVIVAELLSNEIGGNKADWYTKCLQSISAAPEIVGAVSIQVGTERTLVGFAADWRVNSSPTSLLSFKNSLDESFK